MAYIGSSPASQGFIPGIDYFSGNGSTLAFTLSRNVTSVYQVEVVVDNVIQNPSSAYTVLNNTITFTSAPLTGTNNIWVEYVTFNSSLVQPGAGTVNTVQLGDINSITSSTYLALKTNVGVERMRIDASGNVGIGTSSPSSVLNVKSSAPIFRLETTGTVTSTGTAYNVIRDSTGSDVFVNGFAGLANCYQFGTVFANGFMRFLTGNQVEAMRIDSSGNVGIGTGAPSYRLEVKGASATAGQLSIHDGTGDTTVSGVTAASLLFQCRDTSIRTVAEIDAVNTTTNGTGGAMVFQTRISDALAERMRIDSSGNVGIGTSSPSTQLHIALATAKIRIDTTSAASNNPELQLTAVARQFNIGVGGATFATTALQGSYYIYDNTATTYRMVIDVAGNVGIGKSNPSTYSDSQGAVLAVGNAVNIATIQPRSDGPSGAGNGVSYGVSYVTNPINGARIWLGSAGPTGQQGIISFNTKGLNDDTTQPAERMRINSSGDVGIGTVSNAGNTLRYLDIQNTDTGASAGAIIRLITNNVANTAPVTVDIIKYRNGQFSINNNDTNAAAFTSFNVGASERMRIDSSGNLLVGTTSSLNTNTKIYAVATGQDDNNGIIQAHNTNSAAGNSASLMTRSYWGTGQIMSWSSSGMRIGMRQALNGGSGQVNYTYSNDNIGFANNSSLGTGALYTNGGVLTNTNPSDARLKTDIQDITLGLDFISQLRPVSYKWLNNRATQDTQYGFIAQDVQEIEPSLVREFESVVDIDSENSDNHKTVIRLGLEEKGIYTAMVKAIQELKAIIDTQSDTITKLQADVLALKGVK